MAEQPDRSHNYSSMSSSDSYSRYLPRSFTSRDSIIDRNRRVTYHSRETDLTPSARISERKERNEPNQGFQSVPRCTRKDNSLDEIPKSKPIHKLTCPVCLHDYNFELIPKILSCGHTFCSICLEKMQKSQNNRCPLCKKTELRGFSDLPTNFLAYEVNEANSSVEECKIHKREIGAFCSNDKTLLCWECLIPHTRHSVFLISDPKLMEITSEKRKAMDSLSKSLKISKEKWQTSNLKLEKNIEDLNSHLDSHINGFNQIKAEIISKIQSAVEQCIEELREKSKIPEVKKIAEKHKAKIKRISTQIDELTKEKEDFEKSKLLRKLE